MWIVNSSLKNANLDVKLVHFLKKVLDAIFVADLVQQQESDLRCCRVGTDKEVIESVHYLQAEIKKPSP